MVRGQGDKAGLTLTGAVRQVRVAAATLIPGAENGLQTVHPFYQNLPFSPHPCLPFPLPGGFAPARTSDLLFAGCCHPPDSKAELGDPETGGSLPAPPGASLLWKRDEAKGLWHWEIPPSPIRSTAPEALPRWQADDLNPLPTPPRRLHGPHRSDSVTLRGGERCPQGATPRNTVSGPSSAGPGSPGQGSRRRCSYCSRWPWHRQGRR